jgi:ABC-type oligopeptide transport system substrate-binding subunit
VEATGMRQLDRRAFLGLGSLALAGCEREGPYFGETRPPARQQLICATAWTGTSLDPATATELLAEGSVIRALFEGLTNYHPQTMEPMAGIATHHESSPDGMRITLFLRGHPRPHGVRLANTDGLRREYHNGTLPIDLSRGGATPADYVPVYWSDGTPVTAHDVVYSWRRALDPATAGPNAYLLYYIQNAGAFNAGRVAPDKLGVRALDEFTVQVDLQAPTAFFLRLLSCPTFFPVPRQAIEAAQRLSRENSWTEPGSIITSGAFTLRERRPRDCIVLARNPRYIEAGLVGLEEVSLLLIPEVTVGANLYKTGQTHLITGLPLPPFTTRVLSGKRDISTAKAFGTVFPCFNTKKPPFDNVLVRYAFNMATDKRAIADFFGFGRVPARTLVPTLAGYKPPDGLLVRVDNRSYDVLDFDPAGARELLARAGYPRGLDSHGRRLRVDFLTPIYADVRVRLQAEILQQQWRANLNVEVNIATQEFQAWAQNIFSGNYGGVTEYADWGYYLDPNWFLNQFVTGSSVNATGWTDPEYDDMLAKANGTLDPLVRMRRLADCETYLLRAMPFIPVFYDAWAYPQKPYVRGIAPNVMDVHPLKYAWIDTNWRPQ